MVLSENIYLYFKLGDNYSNLYCDRESGLNFFPWKGSGSGASGDVKFGEVRYLVILFTRLIIKF